MALIMPRRFLFIYILHGWKSRIRGHALLEQCNLFVRVEASQETPFTTILRLIY